MTKQDAMAIARQTADRIKNESVEEKKALVLKQNEILASLNVSAEAMALFSQNANTGIEDIGMNVSMPVLRVHTAGSTKNITDNGDEPNIGEFFYTGTKQILKDPVVHILSIKKCLMPKKDSTELKSNYLVAGILDETNQPFVMYINGMSYNKVWAFSDMIKPFVKNKAAPIPMFALKVVLYSEKEQDQNKKYAPQPVIKYKLLIDEETQFPLIETNVERITWLKEGADKANDAMDELIATYGQKAVNKNEYVDGTPIAGDLIEFEEGQEDDDISSEDTPF